MKISEVTEQEVKRFVRISEEDDPMIPLIMSGAKSYIMGFTGLREEQMDALEDLTLAYLVLCCEMYDNRNITVDNDKVNPYVQNVLAMHAVNYL